MSESNYERARNRLELGVANRAALYRWQPTKANAPGAGGERGRRRETCTHRAEPHHEQPLGDQYHANALYDLISSDDEREVVQRRLEEALRG